MDKEIQQDWNGLELSQEEQEDACWVLLAKEMEPHFVEAVITIEALVVEVAG